jgi:hypothetical protein
LRVKKDNNPIVKLGYNWDISLVFSNHSCGKGISSGSTPASNRVFTGIEM